MANDFCPTCPADCDYDLPAIDCSTCIVLEKGQISKLYIGIVGNPLADPAGSDMPARLDNSTLGDDTLIRTLCVKGEWTASDDTSEELECDINIVTRRSNSITLESNNLTDDNYDFNRTLQKCQGKHLIWFTMLDEKNLYGGEPGITVSINPVVQSTGSERADRLQTQYIITWDADCAPPRIVNPVAGLIC